MSKVQPIPQGMTAVTPHLVCRNAAEAIEFYKKAFGAVEYARLPDPNGKVMHAMIAIGGASVMLVDEYPEQGMKSPQTLGGSPVTIHLYVADVDTVFNNAIAAGATVRMPVADMFWGDRYGVLVDPFGHSWSVATHIRDVSPEEMDEAMKTAGADSSGQKQ